MHKSLKAFDVRPVDRIVHDVVPIVEAIGSERFEPVFMRFIKIALQADICGAYVQDGQELHCVFAGSLREQETTKIASDRYVKDYWHSDPIWSLETDNLEMGQAVVGIEISEINDLSYRNQCFEYCGIVDKMTIMRTWNGRPICLSVMKHKDKGRFTSENEANFVELGAILISSMLRHKEFARLHGRELIRRLPEERARNLLLDLNAGLTERELDVCSRGLMGLTSEGTALDLGISTHTVITYRKRAYSRLAITSQAELFAICLSARDLKPMMN